MSLKYNKKLIDKARILRSNMTRMKDVFGMSF